MRTWERPLPRKWFATLIWWSRPLLSRWTKGLRRKSGISKGELLSFSYPHMCHSHQPLFIFFFTTDYRCENQVHPKSILAITNVQTKWHSPLKSLACFDNTYKFSWAGRRWTLSFTVILNLKWTVFSCFNITVNQSWCSLRRRNSESLKQLDHRL